MGKMSASSASGVGDWCSSNSDEDGIRSRRKQDCGSERQRDCRGRRCSRLDSTRRRKYSFWPKIDILPSKQLSLSQLSQSASLDGKSQRMRETRCAKRFWQTPVRIAACIMQRPILSTSPSPLPCLSFSLPLTVCLVDARLLLVTVGSKSLP